MCLVDTSYTEWGNRRAHRATDNDTHHGEVKDSDEEDGDVREPIHGELRWR